MLRTSLLLLITLGQAVLLAQRVPAALSDAAQVTLAGLVRNESGQALRGALISVAAAGGRTGRVHSDQNGRFAVSRPRGTPIVLRVTKAGYAPRQVRLSGSDESGILEIPLVSGAAIGGVVLDDRGERVPDIRVTVRPQAEASPSGGTAVESSAVTDDLGEYRIGSLPAGRYEVALAGGIRVLRSDLQVSRSGLVQGSLNIISMRPRGARNAAGEPAAAVVDLEGGEEARLDLVESSGDGAGARVIAAVSPASPRRSRASSQPTATVSGRVLGPGSRPVAQASVRLVSATGWPPNQLATFDQTGRYEFTFVQPGLYRIVATSAGLVDGEYAAGPRIRDRWVDVREGDRLDDFDIVLRRAAVITGTVVDRYGEPLEGMAVHAWAAIERDGRTQLSAATGLPRLTDDRGRYRIYGLQPGTYYVAVSEPGPSSAAAEPAAAILAMFTPVSPAPAPTTPTVYYPGRSSIREAAPVRVDVGLDATGVDVQFTPSPAARVTGLALMSSGEPFRGWVTLRVSRASGAPLLPPWRVATDTAGAFEFPGVPSGDYVLQADGQQSRLLAMHDGRSAVRPGGAVIVLDADHVSAEFGAQPVTVGDMDVGPVVLRTLAGSTLSGRLVQEGPGPRAANAAFLLDAVTADPDSGRSASDRIRASVDGTFEVSGLVGPVRFVPADAPGGWWLRSVMLDGVNAADDPVMFGTQAQSKRNVQVVFSSVPTGIAGRVRERGQDAVTGAAVIAFSVNPSRWFDGSRHLKRGTSIDGRFTIPALPPGDYYVVAVDTVDTTQWQDPAFLQQLTPFATFVSVSEGQTVNEDLDLVRLP